MFYVLSKITKKLRVCMRVYQTMGLSEAAKCIFSKELTSAAFLQFEEIDARDPKMMLITIVNKCAHEGRTGMHTLSLSETKALLNEHMATDEVQANPKSESMMGTLCNYLAENGPIVLLRPGTAARQATVTIDRADSSIVIQYS